MNLRQLFFLALSALIFFEMGLQGQPGTAGRQMDDAAFTDTTVRISEGYFTPATKE